jgi:hypothetical protein
MAKDGIRHADVRHRRSKKGQAAASGCVTPNFETAKPGAATPVTKAPITR